MDDMCRFCFEIQIKHSLPKTDHVVTLLKVSFPRNKMPSLIRIGVLVENDVKFYDNSMDFSHKNPIKMNQNL